ncbi:eukaryotic rRNA processing [Mycotypha africana]|uniref:eukaryotic rRNA processing n=1 Tax=Mycotypha africana TaxID=64632 RepID=UPI002300BF80|nr:eukaryotic rRNA processing [Mycotypha africana]KAI8987353.1 eukaryotic rRNA processing [Mycotypha africana]
MDFLNPVINNQDTIEPAVEWVRYEDVDPEDIDDEYGDMVIEQKLLVNNEDALVRIKDDLKMRDLEWIDMLTVTSAEPIKVADAFDDLSREDAFYKQALEAAYVGRSLALQAETSFLKPDDFIAPMLKNDEQMEAVRQRLVAEAKDGNEEALRRLHQFNKEQKKAQANERAKILKRKKKEGSEVKLDDDFTLDLEEAERIAAEGLPKGERPFKLYDRESRAEKYALGKRKNAASALNPARKGMSINKKSSLKKNRPGKSKRQKLRK